MRATLALSRPARIASCARFHRALFAGAGRGGCRLPPKPLTAAVRGVARWHPGSIRVDHKPLKLPPADGERCTCGLHNHVDPVDTVEPADSADDDDLEDILDCVNPADRVDRVALLRAMAARAEAPRLDTGLGTSFPAAAVDVRPRALPQGILEPTVVLIIADEKSPLYSDISKLRARVDSSDAELVVASTAAGFLHAAGAEKLSKASVLVVAVFAAGRPGVAADLWPHCPSLRWVHSLAAGVDTLVPVLRALPGIDRIAVTNAKGAFSRSLAEYSLCAMLHFNKQVPRIQRNKEAKRWSKFVMHELHGLSVGFVGFGDIGQSTARLCRAFGMRVLALRRRKALAGTIAMADETFGSGDAEERLELFRRADFVVCSLPGTPDTQHFCGAREFGAMKETAVFISVGRGACVDEAALCEALSTGSIAGAALDVFEQEPLAEGAAVWDAPNTLITSHNADLTRTYIEDSWAVFTGKLASFREAPSDFASTVSLQHGY